MEHKKIKIGLMGAWQDHIYRFADYILQDGDLHLDSCRHWLEARYSECEIVSVWDSVPERGQKLADYCGCRFVADIDAFVNDPEMDAVIMCSETALHGRHTVLCANAGKHVFVEKAPFATLEDAYLAREAVKRSGIHFMVSSPMDKPRNRCILNMISDGLLGEVTALRFRLYSEAGPKLTEPVGIYNREENGGGAMIDYGQHGVHIAQMFLGPATSCTANFNYLTDFAKKYHTEDNAVATFRHENGAYSVVEAGWCAPSHECILDVCGTKGAVHLIGDAKVFHADGSYECHDFLSCRLNGKDWVDIPESEFPECAHYPLRGWIETILNDTPDERFTIDDAVVWTEMLDAAYRAAAQTAPIL